VRDVNLLEIAIEILDRSSRYLPGNEQARKNIHFNSLIRNLEMIIENNSLRGCHSLIEYYRNKSRVAQSFLNYKYGTGGSRA
ncbi:MAG: glycosyl transferase, partial [Firmicutes bacterium]|nr:glycosyl transferase [Bacillota bacterium]